MLPSEAVTTDGSNRTIQTNLIMSVTHFKMKKLQENLKFSSCNLEPYVINASHVFIIYKEKSRVKDPFSVKSFKKI